MKFLILSDLHAGITTQQLETIEKIGADETVTLGDISKQTLEAIIRAVRRGVEPSRQKYCCKEIFSVYGNHDDFIIENIDGVYKNRSEIDDPLPTLCSINNSNFLIAFLNGSHAYREGVGGYTYPQFLTHKESVQFVKDYALPFPKSDILFSHDCAFGSEISNKKDPTHCGLKGITLYLKRRRPKWHFHGHYHENRTYKFGKTDCVCVYGAAVFDYENNSIERIF